MNKEVIDIYKGLLKDLYKLNANIVVTGSFATMLYINTAHRICNDIDIHFTDDCSIIELINQVNKLYNTPYKVIDFSINEKSKCVKLTKEFNENSRCTIILDVFNKSSIDYQELDGIKAIKLEKLIANKLIGCTNIKDSVNPRIKDLYDLQFLLRLKYDCDLIFHYLHQKLETDKIDKLFNGIISNIYRDLYKDIFTEYKANNYTTEDLKLDEIQNKIRR